MNQVVFYTGEVATNADAFPNPARNGGVFCFNQPGRYMRNPASREARRAAVYMSLTRGRYPDRSLTGLEII